MGLLDVLNGMQNGPRGPSNPGAQTGGGMSPMTMAILALLAYKAVKHFGGSEPNAAPSPAPSRGSTVNAALPSGGMGGGLGDLLKGGLGACLPAARWKRDQRRARRPAQAIPAERPGRHRQFMGEPRPEQGDFAR